MDQDKKPDTILKADNKTIFIVVMVFVVLVIAIFTYVNTTKKRQAEPSPAQPQTTTATTTVAAQGLVSITSNGFIPQTLSIRKGDQVKWTNTDQLPHRIISDSLASLNSGKPLNTNDSFIFTFEQSGTFTYHDGENPEKFQGTILVQ